MCSTTSTHGDLGLTDKNGACTCSADAHGHADAVIGSTAASSVDYLVAGMTCSHCVASVTEELEALDGVEAVSVDLNAGGTSTVTVSSAAPLDADAVRAAIGEAGYSLVSA
ncbi:heavy-metal-associated domain-containing protein [Leifsonia sp. 1010]|uniref:heavy-metal-associated domain-containing protein n=1 Tax=Leifsonia sp. 1010 TaxID=2817769 RepID=UPI0028569AF1|nr:heavy-metal-associated domain-containing protein [Leifsonia sp. 1010]MDR6611221.1 copper chaperone CopZ [Leifsonia sp. 1010]